MEPAPDTGLRPEESKIAALERQVAELRAALDLHASAPFGEGLREREALLSEAERIIHCGSWMWDVATGTIHWSAELYRILGVDPAVRPQTDTFFACIHPDDLPRVQATSARGLETHQPEPVDFRVVWPDGTVRECHMRAAIVKEPAGLRFVGTVRDVTERNALQAQLQQARKREAIGTLAGGVAHDFNNYLQVIAGHVDLLLMTIPSGTSEHEKLAQIRSAASRAQHLTQQLLLLGRKKRQEPEVVALDALVDATVPMLTAVLGDRIRIRRVVGHAVVHVRIDPGSLEQVVVNLALNARDAMPGGGRLTLDVDTVDLGPDSAPTVPPLPPGRYARLVVEDDGTGIPAHVLPHIFEAFYTTKPVGSGTGLGLATALDIATEAGGALRVESTVGRGTAISVILPLQSATAPAARVPPVAPATARAAHAPPIQPPPRGCVLLVEDQAEVRAALRAMLEHEKFEVIEAEDGVAALRALAARPDVKIVLSDLSMPRMTGGELSSRLSADRPDLPVVLMGGLVDSNAAGLPGRILTKPFRRADLVRALDEALRRTSA